MGDRLELLRKAEKSVAERCGKLVSTSSVYETAAWGFTDQPAFLNQVWALETPLLPEVLMHDLLELEQEMGRVRTVKMGPRTIDLDILLVNGLIIHSPGLTLPHPALPQRRFALVPLAEIAPLLLHPVEKKTILQLLADCTDPLDVQKIYVPD